MGGGPGTGTPQSALFPMSVFRFLRGGIPDGFRVKESANRPGMVLAHSFHETWSSGTVEDPAARESEKFVQAMEFKDA